MKSKLLLGAHTSIAGGFDQAISRGNSIGCTTIQIFTKSNRQWRAKPLTAQEVNAFQNTWQRSSIQSIIAHAAYLINLASPHTATAAQSAVALRDELMRCTELGIPALVLHPGSRGDLPIEQALLQITKQLDAVLEQTPPTCSVLLETMAGQGTNLCDTLEHIRTIYNNSHHKERIGVCVDTCHVFAAGYDIRTIKTYEKFWRLFDEIVGLSLLQAIHLNDSKGALGSRLDRHTDIGMGRIGLEAFRLICSDSRFTHIPKILETPKETLEDDARNMATIKALFELKNR